MIPSIFLKIVCIIYWNNAGMLISSTVITMYLHSFCLGAEFCFPIVSCSHPNNIIHIF